MAKSSTSTQENTFSDIPDVEAPKGEGWQETGRPDLNGWWVPQEGRVFQGKIISSFKYEDRPILLVRLTKPCMAGDPVEKDADGLSKMIRLDAGQVLAVGVSYKLQDLMSYIEYQGECWVKCGSKKKIKGGHTMWSYEVKVKGKRSTPPVDEEVPF